MTKPTPAQIEAALDAYCGSAGGLRRCLTAALTAAAEVGEQMPDDTFEHGRLVTIERCAQVADEYVGEKAMEIAAAIRALAK